MQEHIGQTHIYMQQILRKSRSNMRGMLLNLYFASQVENDFPSNEMEMRVSFPLFLLQEQHEQQKYEKINIFLLNSISQDYIN